MSSTARKQAKTLAISASLTPGSTTSTVMGIPISSWSCFITYACAFESASVRDCMKARLESVAPVTISTLALCAWTASLVSCGSAILLIYIERSRSLGYCKNFTSVIFPFVMIALTCTNPHCASATLPVYAPSLYWAAGVWVVPGVAVGSIEEVAVAGLDEGGRFTLSIRCNGNETGVSMNYAVNNKGAYNDE